jgi:hypothetical protein
VALASASRGTVWNIDVFGLVDVDECNQYGSFHRCVEAAGAWNSDSDNRPVHDRHFGVTHVILRTVRQENSKRPKRLGTQQLDNVFGAHRSSSKHSDTDRRTGEYRNGRERAMKKIGEVVARDG